MTSAQWRALRSLGADALKVTPVPVGSGGATGTLARWWRRVAAIQGAYFLGTGIWPILHIESFMAVTGPKTDLWLVKLFGALVCVPGAVVALAAATGRLDRSALTGAIGSAIVLAAGDLWYVWKGTLRHIYLLDAVIELALVLAWVTALWARRGRN